MLRQSAKMVTSSDAASRQIVSKVVAFEEVVDILAAAGLKRPDISILSDEFLEDVRRLPYRILQKLLSDAMVGITLDLALRGCSTPRRGATVLGAS